jgi:hypothetical protein
MGTRGLYGFRFNGIDKTTYNGYDSYPEGLGLNMINFICSTDRPTMKKIFVGLVMVNEDTKPTALQIAECESFTDLSVSTGSVNDWYCLLRKTQGGLSPYLTDELHYMIDGHNFILNSLFCEWGYIINLDTDMLEIWQGFQEKSQPGNRYGEDFQDHMSDKYYPCALIIQFPLDNIPKDWTHQINMQQARECGGIEEDEFF